MLEERVFGKEITNKNITYRSKGLLHKGNTKGDNLNKGQAKSTRHNNLNGCNLSLAEEKKENINSDNGLEDNFAKVGKFLIAKRNKKSLNITEDNFKNLDKVEYDLRHNPQYVVEYSCDIYNYLKEIEVNKLELTKLL